MTMHVWSDADWTTLSHDVTQCELMICTQCVCSGLSDVRDHVHASVNVGHRVVLKHVHDVAIVCAVFCS